MLTVELAGGRRATYETIGSGDPMMMFPGGPGLAARYLRPAAELLADRLSVTWLIRTDLVAPLPPVSPPPMTTWVTPASTKRCAPPSASSTWRSSGTPSAGR